MSVEPAAPYDYIVCRRRHRRLPARQPAERRPAQARPADRGRRQRRLPLDPHPGRLPVLHRQPAHRLAVRDRAGRRASTAGACAIRAARCSAAARSINGMIYMRGQARDYDGWAAATAATPTWSWDECLPVLPRARGLLPGRRRVPRRARVRPDRQARRRRMAGREAAPALGRPRRLRRGRAARPASRAATTSTAATTRASATSRSTSAPASAGTRPRRSCGRSSAGANLQVWTGAHIDRRRARRRRPGGRRARSRRAGGGAPARRGSRPAARSILAAGAIGTPQILQLSGIGAGGAAARRTASTSRARPARRRREPAGPPADPRRLRRRGRADAEHAGATAAGARRGSACEYALAAQRADEHGAVAARRLHAQPARSGRIRTSSTTSSRCRSMPSASRCTAIDAFTASVCNLNPTSRGKVRIRSARSGDAPRDRARLPGHRRGPPRRRRRACA